MSAKKAGKKGRTKPLIVVAPAAAASPSSTPKTDAAAYEATTRTVGKWIVPLAKAQHIERELAKATEKAEHLSIALVTGNDAIESLTRDLRTVIEVARKNMPRKHGTIERLAANLPEERLCGGTPKVKP